MSWKLLSLAAVFALGLLALMPGGATQSPSARADIDRISAEDLSIESGDHTEITIVADDDDGDVTVSVSSVDAGTTFELRLRDCDGCDEDGDEEDQEGTDLPIDSDDSNFPGDGVLQFRLTLTCEDRDRVTVRAEQDDDDLSVGVTCNPEGNIVIGNSADDDDSVDFDFEISGDRSCRDDFTLADNDELSFKCDTGETYTITEDVPQGWELTEIDCDDENVPSRDIDVDLDDASVTIELSDEDDSVDCTFINQLEEAGSPNSVVLTTSNTTPTCGLPIVVLATVEDQRGNLLEGVAVIFTATRGTFTIQAGTTIRGGRFSTLYTPPNSGSGLIVISATAGGVVGTLPIQLTCAVATPTVSPPPTTQPPTTQPPIIRPPSTGDAGLVETSSSSWTLLGIAGALASVMAAVGKGMPSFFRAQRRTCGR